MPMFDDPRKELKRLQEELLAEEAEYPEEEPETPGGFDDELEDILELIRDEKQDRPREYYQEPMYRNFANNYGREQVRNYANNYGRGMSDALMEENVDDDDSALYADEYYDREPRKKKKEKGIRGLVILAVLEVLGIVAIAAWWVKFLWL